MNTFLPAPNTIVEEALQRVPQAARIFLDHRTNCIGCRLARFCTLAEVADVYEISLQTLLYDLQQNLQILNHPKE